ncbi:MAG TPA: TlpA disulfide reductase family protein [Caulobacteraceae bacterium]|nr:TlpA disulfide reductase family protein [Caulobacteraceae bacterium]
MFLALAGALALLYGPTGCSKPPGDLSDLARGPMAALKPSLHPAPAPRVAFRDGAGQAHTLAEFKGKVVVVNLWANWCPPCKAEIPSLARLAGGEAGRAVAIVPISVGKGDDETAGRAFIAKNPPLAFYTEPTYRLAFAFAPPVGDMPTTVIFDRHGVERARLAGGADWSTPEARAVVERLLTGP